VAGLGLLAASLLVVALALAAGSLSAAPDTITFGAQDVDEGPTSTQASSVTNAGPDPVAVDAVSLEGVDAGQFALDPQPGDCDGSTVLDMGESCDVHVDFDPTATGGKSATLRVSSADGDATVALSGTGTQTALAADPASLPFGAHDVDAGPTATQESTVENAGDQPVTIAAIAVGGANPAQFKRLTGDAGDCAAATTLQPGEQCAVRAVFDPSFKGAKAATITIDSNAPDVTISLTGTGTESVYESSDDPLDEGHVTNGQVNAVAFDSAGRTYLGGTFTHVGPRTGHGVKLSESSDDPAPGFPDVNGTIRAVAPDGSGGWFVGGDFTSVGGVPRSRLAHIEASGTLDPDWTPSADGRVNALAVDGGHVFAGGQFAAIDGSERTFLAKLSAATGAVDATWHPIVNNAVSALAVDGTALHVGGDFTQVGGEPRNRLARVSTAGSGATDALWNPDANGSVAALAVSGGDVYAGGAFTQVAGESRPRIVKLTGSGGAPDPTWNAGADNRVSALAISGSDLFAGGAFTTIGGQPRARLAKLSTTTGTVDTGFDAAPNAPVHALAVSAAGLYTAGEFTQVGGEDRSRLARVATGTGDADAWDPAANGTARALALAGTDVYAGGDFTSVGATARDRLARLEPDGTLDPDWDPGANNTVAALAVSGSDVYVGGSFTSIAGEARNRIAKLSTGGGGDADATWNPGASSTVSALAVSGTTVYAGGLFLTIDGQSRSRLARLTGAGGDLDAAWAPAGASGQVNALALAGSDLFAGGAFTAIAGASRSRIAKLDAGGTGTVDGGWNPGASSTVSALAVTGSDLYAGGFFTTIGGQPRTFLAQLGTATGVVDPDWDPKPNSVVRSIALSATDVYVGGDFTQVGDRAHSRLAKLPQTGTGTADSGWDPEVTGGSVLGLAVSGDRLAAGGSFTAVGGQSSQGFALLELPALASDPGGLHFGERDVDDGPSAVLTSTIANPRAETVTFTAVSLGGRDAADFERLTGDPQDCTASTVLDAGEACTVRARFDPASPGGKLASVGIVANAPGIQVALTGTGTQSALAAAPESLSFGARDVDEGATAAQTSTVTNAGTEQVDFSSVALEGADAADFERLTGEPGDCTDTTILQPAQTCTLRARFDPAGTGAKSAALTVESTADDVSVALSGTAIQTQLSRAPASLSFGPHDVDDGPAPTQESTVTNSGTELVTISGVATTGDAGELVRLTSQGSDCATGTELSVGETCKVRVEFDPATTGAKAATVTLTSNAADVTVGLSGTGTQTQLEVDPGALSFGSRDVDDGPATEQQSAVTNTGTEAVTIGALSVSGDADDFARATGDDGDCAADDVLAPGDTCVVRVRFDPATVGTKSATITIESNAPDVGIAASGTGIQTELSRAPASLAFGPRDIDDGPTATQQSTVTNSGTETVDLDAVTIGGADAGDFAQLADEGTDCTAATTLAAGQTCEVRIRFDPAATGARSASVTVQSNAADVSVELSGTGTQTLLTREPATLAFGNHTIDDPPSAARESVVTNAGTEAVTLTAIELTGDTAHFERLTGEPTDCTASTTLAAGETCALRARFAPTTTGAKSATLTVDSNAADVAVALSGTGVLTRLERSAGTLAFGPQDVDDGPTAVQQSTIANTGSETVTFSSVALSGDTTQFERLTDQAGDCGADTVLTAGQSCDLRVRFDPTATGAHAATATILSDAPDQVVALSGTGTQTLLTRSPDTLAFGPQDVDDGATAVQTATVTNSGSEPVGLDGVAVTADSGEFERLTSAGTDCTVATTLTAGQTCELRFRFDPTATGAKAATATVASDAADVAVALSGTGTQTQLTADPDDLGFGAWDVDDGATAGQTSVVENTGSEPVTLAAIAVPSGWVRLTGEASDCAAGEALAAGETCDLRLAFDPSATGAQTGTATIDSNAPDETVGLSGTGTQTELTRSPATLTFGDRDVNEGPAATQESTVTNSGTEAVSIVAVSESADTGAAFERVTGQGGDCTTTTTLAAGQSCAIRVRFDPSAQGAHGATYTVDSNAADVAVAATGTGTLKELSAASGALAFGDRDVDDGPAVTQVTAVENTGDQAITVAGVGVTGDTAHFERLTDEASDCGAGDVLAPGEACDVRARFDPASVGAKTATVTIDSNAPDETVGLSGTGIQTELSRAPASLSFGSRDVDDGPAATQEATITNTGTQTVELDAVTIGGTDPAQFAQLIGEPADCTPATTLTAGQACELRLRFDPTAMGAKAASATVESSAADVSVTLSGTGIQTELTRTPGTLAFGDRDVDDGATAVQTATVTNSGSETVDLDGVAVTGDAGQFERLTSAGTDCTAATTLAAGQACDLRVRFDPATTGAKAATVTVESGAADVTVALTGRGTQTELTGSPATLSFGARDVDDGATATQTSTIANTGSETVTLSALELSGDAADFDLLGGEAGDCAASTVLAAGEACEVRLRFDPETAGAKSLTATVDSSAADEPVAATGTGTQTELSRSPAALAFGAQDVDDGATLAQSSTVTNSGTEPVTLAGVSLGGPDAAGFERPTGLSTDCAAGTTLAANETCRVRVRFDPAATRAHAASVNVDAEAPAADLTVALTGTGTQTALSRSAFVLEFGAHDVDPGPSGTKAATIANTGSEPVAIDGVRVSGDAADFARLTGDAGDCDAGRTLGAGQACAVRAHFDPSTTGAKTAVVTVDTQSEDLDFTLTGTGTQTELVLTPPALAFGARNLGEGPGAALASTIRNSGTEPVSIGGIEIAGPAAGDFATGAGLPADCAVGRALAAGEQCEIRTAFDPSAAGERTATLTVRSNAADVSSDLTGLGTVTRLVLGSGPSRAGQTARRRFAVRLSALGGTVPRATLTLSRASGGRIARLVVRNVSSPRTVRFRLRRPLPRGRYRVTATAPAAAEVGRATRVYRLR
jgi:hypothetical protein